MLAELMKPLRLTPKEVCQRKMQFRHTAPYIWIQMLRATKTYIPTMTVISVKS